MAVKRIFVEKKNKYDVEARRLLRDFRSNLAVPGLHQVRLILRYDVEGLESADFDACVKNVFSEPAVDAVYLEEPPLSPEERVFAVEYLPGQYDQRADSAAQCISLLTGGERPAIRAARLYALSGEMEDAQLAAIKRYVINPVDSREASMEKPQTLELKLAEPAGISIVQGFTDMDDAQAARFREDRGLAMSTADVIWARDYFRTEQRDPTETELKVIDTYWSDHCRHSTFMTKLTDVAFEDGPVGAKIQEVYEEYLSARQAVYKGRQKDVCLMDMATLYAKEAKAAGLLKNLDESEEINACSFRQTVQTDRGPQEYLIQFKNETHNHPTEIEPFGGAATCLGGAIRDPLSGRAYVYQAMRVTGSGDPRERVADTMPFKLPQRKITREAAKGYSSYGNQIGLATGLVQELYHPGYKAKRLEIGAVVGAAPAENVVRAQPTSGDAILLIGGRTGRDGCGGATGSSKAHDERSIGECGAEVQKGNPLTERKLQRLFRNPAFSQKIKRCNDFGAGGVCVAIGELAESLDIDLDQVPKKYAGLDGTELAISESQERMAVVVAREDVAHVLALAGAENLEAVAVAQVTDTGRLRFTWRGKTIVDIQRAFLDTNGAPQYAKALVQNGESHGLFHEFFSTDLEETLAALLGDLNICSQKGLLEQFDSTIGAGTVTMPLGGRRQLSPAQAMAAAVPVAGGSSQTATIMSFGADPYLMEKSPFHGAVYAVISALAKLTAAGGDVRQAWLTLQEYFERLGSKPERWGKPVAALLGAWYAQRGMGIAAIGGKDSMSGSFRELDVPPTLCAFAICPSEVDAVLSPEFKQAGSTLYVLDISRNELSLPVFEDVRQKYARMFELAQSGAIRSACAVDRGGILAAAVKQALGNELGVAFFEDVSLEQLTRSQYGALLVEADCSPGEGFVPIARLTPEPEITACGQRISLARCQELFEAPLEKVFPTRVEQPGEIPPESTLHAQRTWKKPIPPIAKPRVVIPVFPGTNCEYDTEAVFREAGAAVQTLVIRNLSPGAIRESVDELARLIRNAQIVMLPGGFSGGDEPDGSGKFIATVLRNPQVSDAVTALLEQRDGLMLGICNGFQALIKLGLVPHGKILPMREDSPTLTFNAIGRHVSCMANTRITSTNSPWLAGVSAGDVHRVAVSHGEGRFVASETELSRLFANGQVATQYVDESGNPQMDIAWNSNGSMGAVEGLLSPDGRVFGKMGHSERFRPGLLRNVPGEKDQKIFVSGVQYFQ